MALDLGKVLAKQVPRDIETITGEIMELKQTAGEAILGIGRCLIEAKAVLPHGEWLPWLTEKVEFSERAAQNFMRLAREWSNPQALADLGATKALTLLALPPDERDQFIADAHVVNGEEKNVVDMTSRELEKAIRERKAALEGKERAEATIEKLEKEIRELKSAPIEVAVMEVEPKIADPLFERTKVTYSGWRTDQPTVGQAAVVMQDYVINKKGEEEFDLTVGRYTAKGWAEYGLESWELKNVAKWYPIQLEETESMPEPTGKLVFNGWMPGGTPPSHPCDVVAKFDLGDGAVYKQFCHWDGTTWRFSKTRVKVDAEPVKWMVLPPDEE